MPRSSRFLVVACFFGLAACGPASGSPDGGTSDGAAPADSGIPPVGATRQSLHHEFPSFDLAPGDNVWGPCQSWTLNNDHPLWVHSVRMSSAGSFHHSNWMFVTDDMYAGADGTWDCSTRSYDEITAGVAGGVLFAQSTQAANDLQAFPDGDAILVPAHARILGGVHLLNATTSNVHTAITFDIETYGDADVRVALQPLYIDYLPISLPPHQLSSAQTDCDLRAQYRRSTGHANLDFHIVYVLPHFHEMATDWALEVVGGPHDGESIYTHAGGVGDPLGMTLATPYAMDGASGVRMRCTYDNETSGTVHYGLSRTSEMCTMLAYTDGPVKFANVVGDGTNVVGPVVDGVQTNTGPCSVIGFSMAP